MPSLNDIRSTFLDYFARQGHQVVPSSPLVPRNDPTLMFTNAGMVQFKNVFTGLEKRDYVRAATSQKCVRAGGKHNDLDNVGYTARHHTFFEMLGNFSFGDYFKEQAIPFAWELLTRDFGLPKDRLLVTVYHDDDAAADALEEGRGPARRAHHPHRHHGQLLDDGPDRPLRPLLGDLLRPRRRRSPAAPRAAPDEDGDRFIEIWNLVFMQFEQFEDGSRTPLPRPSIDTGMGLERIGAVLQGKHDNYDTDLMRALIEASANATALRPRRAGAHPPPGDRRPPALDLLPDRRRRAALQRGPRLRAAPDHAPRHAPRAPARRRGPGDVPPGPGAGRPDGRAPSPSCPAPRR